MPFNVGDPVWVEVEEGCQRRSNWSGYVSAHRGPTKARGKIYQVGQTWFEGHPYTVEFTEGRRRRWGQWPTGDYAEDELRPLERPLLLNTEMEDEGVEL